MHREFMRSVCFVSVVAFFVRVIYALYVCFYLSTCHMPVDIYGSINVVDRMGLDQN